MTNKNVGADIIRPIKKILSLVLSLAMLCTMLTAFGVTASAEGTDEISDFDTLKSTIDSATDPIVIDIVADFVSDGSSIYIENGKDITINLNGHTIEAVFSSNGVNPSTLTINGNGTLKGINGNLYVFDFNQGSTLIANNVKIIGADATGENEYGKYGISILNATAKLTNCYVSSGKSTGTAENYSAIDIYEEAKCYVENCTFAKGGGGSLDSYYIIDAGGSRGKLYDFSGNEINFTDDKVTPVVIGTGYATPVDGDTIKDTDGTPAKGNSPVSATTSIPAPTYTVTIPATVNFGDQKQALEKYRNEDSDQFGKAVVVSKPFTVSATGVTNLFNDLDDGFDDYINVTAEFDGKLKGTTKDTNTVPYTIKQGENELATGDIIATFYNDVDLASKGKTNLATATIYMNRADIKNVDSYIGTMTFNIARADKANG